MPKRVCTTGLSVGPQKVVAAVGSGSDYEN